MQLDFDLASVALSNAATASETLVAWLNVRLMNFGLDLTTILMRGPSLVLMGVAFSAVRSSLRRIRCFGAERAKLVCVRQPERGRVYTKPLVCVTSGHGSGET